MELSQLFGNTRQAKLGQIRQAKLRNNTMAGAERNLFELSTGYKSSSGLDSPDQNGHNLDLVSILKNESIKPSAPQGQANPEVTKFAEAMEGQPAYSCAMDLREKITTMPPAEAKKFVEELKQVQNLKFAPELVLTTTGNETKVEFIDSHSKDNSRKQVATITDKQVIPEGQMLLIRKSTDAQLLAMAEWTAIKGAMEAYKCLVRGSAFNPKVALAELAIGAVVAAAIAPTAYELFLKDNKEKSKQR
jgi:hypothetical protein